MTENLKHIDLDDEQFADTSKALREYAAKLKKTNARLKSELGQVRTALAARAVRDLLRQGNFANPGRVERALLADEVDLLDANAVEAWFAANGDSYARAAEQGESEEPAPAPAAEEIQFDPEQEQFETYLSATGQGVWSAPTERHSQ